MPLAGKTKVIPVSTPQALVSNTVAARGEQGSNSGVPWDISKSPITEKGQRLATSTSHEGAKHQSTFPPTTTDATGTPGLLHHISLRPVISLSSQIQKPETSHPPINPNKATLSASHHHNQIGKMTSATLSNNNQMERTTSPAPQLLSTTGKLPNIIPESSRGQSQTTRALNVVAPIQSRTIVQASPTITYHTRRINLNIPPTPAQNTSKNSSRMPITGNVVSAQQKNFHPLASPTSIPPLTQQTNSNATMTQNTKCLHQNTTEQLSPVKTQRETGASPPQKNATQLEQQPPKQIATPSIPTQNPREHQQHQAQPSQSISTPRGTPKFTIRHINLPKTSHNEHQTFSIRHINLPSKPNQVHLQTPLQSHQQSTEQLSHPPHSQLLQLHPLTPSSSQQQQQRQQTTTTIKCEKQLEQINEQNQQIPSQKFVVRRIFIKSISQLQNTQPAPSNTPNPNQTGERNIQVQQPERGKISLPTQKPLTSNTAVSAKPQAVHVTNLQSSVHQQQRPSQTPTLPPQQNNLKISAQQQIANSQSKASNNGEQLKNSNAQQQQQQTRYIIRRINIPTTESKAKGQSIKGQESMNKSQEITLMKPQESTNTQQKMQLSQQVSVALLPKLYSSQQQQQQQQKIISKDSQSKIAIQSQQKSERINIQNQQNQVFTKTFQQTSSLSLSQTTKTTTTVPSQNTTTQNVPKFRLINISQYLQKQQSKIANTSNPSCPQTVVTTKGTPTNQNAHNIIKSVPETSPSLSERKALTTNSTNTASLATRQQCVQVARPVRHISQNANLPGIATHAPQKTFNACESTATPLLKVPSEGVTMKTEVTLSVVNEQMFRVTCKPELKPVLVQMVKVRQSFNQGTLRPSSCDLSFSDYRSFCQELFGLNKSFIVKTIPPHFFQVTSLLSHLLPFDPPKLPEEKYGKLFEYQKEGVKFAVQRNGNCIIADDMGLGKTVQALLVGLYFKDSWPMLIICPSSLRYQWADMAESWCDVHKVSIVESSKCPIDGDCVVISYNLAASMIEQLTKRGFGFVIVDESHYLKNSNTVRSNAILPFLHKAAHTVLLTGTPMVGGPIDLYNQLYAVCKNLHIRQIEFGKRYCEGFYSPGRGWNFKGSSNTNELNAILKTVMIRRKKSEVLQQLPPKTRERVFIGVLKEHKNALQNIQQKMSGKELKKMDERERQSEKHRLVLEYFRNSGAAKMPVVCEYIEERFFSKANQQKKDNEENSCDSNKIVVFAHHKDVLDGISMSLRKNKIEFIRVDGETNTKNRLSLIEAFNTEKKIKVALLSLTACGTGLNCTAAQTAIFAELFWNPSVSFSSF